MPKAYLYNKHTPVAVLTVENGRVDGVGEVLNRDLLPICLMDSFTMESANMWLDTRKIPEKREGLKAARQAFPGFENYRNMFSLSDQYWLQFTRRETWDALNFFTNRYSSVHGDVFFEPWKADEKEAAAEQTPDLTTNGVLMKRWEQGEDGISRLIKAGSEKYHQEPLSEVLASIMLRNVAEIETVEYTLEIHGLRLCSASRNFIGPNQEFVPAFHIYNRLPRPVEEGNFDHLVRACEAYGIKGIREYALTMIGIDHMLGNADRHLGNFGFIRDAETGEITGYAPLFDFGTAFFAPSAKNPRSMESRLFHDVEKKAFRHLMRHVDAEKLAQVDGMKSLVRLYPGLGSREKEAVEMVVDHLTDEILETKRNFEKRNEKDIRLP